MNDNNAAFPHVDSALEQLSRVPVPPDVARRLEGRFQDLCRQLPAQTESVVPSPRRRIPQRFVRASLATGLAALVAVAWFMAIGNQDAWGQVAKAMRSKNWVHWTMQIPKGAPLPAGLRAPDGWFSAEKKVFARRAMNQAAQYIDLASQETYDYDAKMNNSVTRSLTRDIDNVDVGHFETLLRLVAEGDGGLQLPESPVQIVERTRREVPAGERRWTEYTFTCRDSRRTPCDYQVTFRVDPNTQLPVEMRSTEKFSANDPAAERIYSLEYPEVGPSDIYALGVPHDVQIVDRRRAKTKTAKDIKEFLAAYIQARIKPLEPCTITLLKSFSPRDFSDIDSAFRGKGNGPEMQLEQVDSEQLMEFRKQVWAGQITRPLDVDRMVWWRQQVEGMKFSSLPRGGELLPHQVGYPRELMTLGASPVDNPDCHITLDRKPILGPPETVLLNIRTETSVGFNDCYFWIAPDRDYLVLRHEIHFSRDHAAWNNSTQVIDKVEQSPGGRWYATAVRNGRIAKHGDDLPAELVPAVPGSTGLEIGPVTTSLYRYFIEFK